MISVPKAIQQLSAQIHSSSTKDVAAQGSKGLDRAWTILLDLDTDISAQEQLPELPEESQRLLANSLATSQACAQLSHDDAAQLQQLVKEWLSAKSYVLRRNGMLEAQPAAGWHAASNSSPDHNKSFAVMQLSEHQAVLSLLFALQGSCPPAPTALTALPPLGSSLLKHLQQEAQAVTAAASHNSSSWVPMSPQPEALLCNTAANSSAWGSSVQQQQRQLQESGHQALEQGTTAASDWVSPAAAAMQLLLRIPLDPEAAPAMAGSKQQPRQQQGSAQEEPLDDILLSAACCCAVDDQTVSSIPALYQPTGGAAAAPSLLECVAPMMQLSTSTACLGRPLGGNSSSSSSSSSHPFGAAADSKRVLLRHSNNRKQAAGTSRPNAPQHAAVQNAVVSSAAAVEAAAVVQAAAAIKPAVSRLMQLSSAQPGYGSGSLFGGLSTPGSSVCRTGGSSKPDKGDAASHGADTALARDVSGRAGRLQQQGPHDICMRVASSSSSSRTPQDVEADLVATAHLALQGVWSAVQQLWAQALLQPVTGTGGTRLAGRTLGLSRPAVQHQLIVRVLHAAELRLRLKAFVQHFQHSCSLDWGMCNTSNTTSSSSRDNTNSAEADASSSAAVLIAFVNAVRAVLDEQEAALAAGQQLKLSGGRQQGSPTLLQLLTSHRGMLRQVQQLAEVCWCTVQEFIDKKMYVRSCLDTAGPAETVPPPGTASSTAINWHVVTHTRGGRHALSAAAAGLQGAAAAAYQDAMPWPGAVEAAAAAQLWWAPSTWQMKRGCSGGHDLLERLYAGVLQAEPDTAPLLRHLFAAAAQPVTRSLHTWALLPDTAAAEAAAEATAMASFTAGSSAPESTSSSSSSSATKPWSGSRAAEAAMRQCLQHAWQDICQRVPGCPGFLAHAKQPAAVAGMQLHLLQLLGGPGQRLVDRLGWLAELEQQELQEVLAPVSAIPGTVTTSQPAPMPAGPGVHHMSARQFLGLLCGGRGGADDAFDASRSAGAGAAAKGLLATGPLCSLSAHQLKQCAAITADYQAARRAEVQQLLQSLESERAAGRAAHELWLACRQEERQEVEAVRLRLEAEAAARRKQRQQQLLAAQLEQVAAVQARRLGAHQDQLALERQLLQQAALQEHAQALQHLQAELAQHGNTTQPAAADAGTGCADEANTQGALSGFAAAAAGEEAVDVANILLQVSDALELDQGTGLAQVLPAVQHAQQQQQQQQQQHQRGTWGPPAHDIAPAAGAPSGLAATAQPLAVVGSALAQQQQQQQAGGAAGASMPAAGRRSNSQPRVLPGMGRSLSLSRRNSSSDEVVAGCSTSSNTNEAVTAGSGAGGVGSGAALKAVMGSGMPGCSGGSSSILGGFSSPFGGAAAWGRAQQHQQQHGPHAKGKWGVPIVPGPAAGVPSNLQRRASTGELINTTTDSSSHGSGHISNELCQTLQHRPQLQQRPSSGLGYINGGGGWGSAGRSSRSMSRGRSRSSSRPGSPQHTQRLSEHLGGPQSAAQSAAQQQHMQWHAGGVQAAPDAAGGLAAGSAAIWDGAPGGTTAAAGAGPMGWMINRHLLRPANRGNVDNLDWLVGRAGFGSRMTMGAPAAAAPCSTTVSGSSSKDPSQPAAVADSSSSSSSGPATIASVAGPASGPKEQPADAAAAAASLIATMEVLVVEPLLAQHRLTTHACWSLLLHEHRLLQRLSAIQGLFFQQQGDWVGLLCEALEPLLARQRVLLHQQQCEESATVALTPGAGAEDGTGAAEVEQGALEAAAMISPVVLQLLLESAVQQSCLASVPEADRLSFKAEPGRRLEGWSAARLTTHNRGSSSNSPSPQQSVSASETDCLMLGCDVPWPVSLLVGDAQLQQYADVFSVLLRLRRLQQQLMRQWQPLNHRASNGTTSSSSSGGGKAGTQQGLQRHSSDRGAGGHSSRRGSRSGSSSGGGGTTTEPRRATCPGILQQQASRVSVVSSEPSVGAIGAAHDDADAIDGGDGTAAAAAAAAAAQGLPRLQDLRRWHALALHCTNSLLGYMLGELSGQLQVRFDAAVGSHPVSLPVMLEAHAKLLDAARQVCFLPRPGHTAARTQRQQQQQQERVVAGSGGGGAREQQGLAGLAYELVEGAWQLQGHIAELLERQEAAGAGQGGGGRGDGSASSSSAKAAAVMAKAPSGFREGSSCTALAVLLGSGDGDDGEEEQQLWASLESAGRWLEGKAEQLKRRLRHSVAASVGHPLAGLTARLGV